MKKLALFSFIQMAILLSFANRSVQAEDLSSPIGYWKTIDDKTHKPKAVVYIYKSGDKLYGEIVKLFRKKNRCPKCTKCSGWRKNKPVCGMLILWNLKNKGDYWGDGRILDPNNGKTYRSWIQVIEKGKKLKVRGYIGISLLGRTQYWIRVKKPTEGTCKQVCQKSPEKKKAEKKAEKKTEKKK